MRVAMILTAMFLALAGRAAADTFADGWAAYQHGDYATALTLFQPLASLRALRGVISPTFIDLTKPALCKSWLFFEPTCLRRGRRLGQAAMLREHYSVLRSQSPTLPGGFRARGHDPNSDVLGLSWEGGS